MSTPGRSGPDPFPPETLPIVRALFEALHRANLRYCHWKSTSTLPRALAGRTDLDLLVDRQAADDFRRLVGELGYKPFISHVSRRFPSVEDYLGYDTSSGRLVHLHVYLQLIVGEQYLKNHLLPMESALLDGTESRHGVRVPRPAVELTILVLRTLLKYRDTDAIKDLLRLGRRGGIPPDARAEIEDLRQRASTEELLDVATRHLPSVPARVFSGLLEVLERDRRDARALVRLRREVRRGLRAFERLPWWRARLRHLQARASRAPIIRPLLRGLTRSEMRRKSPVGGGLTVALVGPDGAGKTTLLTGLHDWLGWRLNFTTAYLGSAQPSRPTAATQALSRLARRGTRLADRRRNGRSPVTPLASVAAVLAGVRYLAEARDRSARAARGRRQAAAGAVVVFDRYPLPEVVLDGRVMDGPRIASLAADSSKGLLRLLRVREEAIYRRMPRPDLAVLLALPAEVALSRKSSVRPELVRLKSEAVQRAAQEPRPGVVVVDASRPAEAVLGEVKTEIWKRL